MLCRVIFLWTFFIGFALTEDIEEIKLKDGRVFIGIYNKSEGLIILSGPIKGGVRVKEEDIAERNPINKEVTEPKEDVADKKEAGNKEEDKKEEPQKKVVVTQPDQNAKLIDKQKKLLAKKESDLKLVEGKIDKTKINIYRFRQQFALRSRSEGRYYNPEVPESLFLEERPIELPKSRVNNSGVRGLIVECKKLMAEHEELKKDIENGTKTLAELEAAAAKNDVTP